MTPVIRHARVKDAREILSVLSPFIKQGIVLNRTPEEIAGNIDFFYVAEIDGKICGVSAYYSYSPLLKEIRSLAVDPAASRKGIGRQMVEYVIKEILRESPAAKIFTLTYVPEFFRKIGFHPVDKNCFPEKIWKDCSKCTKAETCGETALVYGEAVSVTPLD